MKHANGAGSVTKVKDRRSKPWKAVITAGHNYDAEMDVVRQKRKVLGYFRTRTEAEDALAEYRRSPYDLDARKITFADLYQKWSAVHFEGISEPRRRGYRSAFSYAAPLHSMRFADIRPYHIEKAMAEADVGAATRNNVKQLCGLLYKYAIKNEICSTNYAAMCDGVRPGEPVRIRSVFSPEEESLLWDSLDYPFVDMLLVHLYSGWRPQEIALLKSEDIDLDGGTMKGGIKTAAGKNRIVPIHSKVYSLVESRLREGSPRLFTDAGKPLTYSMYYQRFDRIADRLGFRHMPHDARHTFITKGKEAGMDEYILKLIVGHAISDITESVYTHRRISELKAEMEKIQ